eukprot:161216-Rhodomonas_salina.4
MEKRAPVPRAHVFHGHEHAGSDHDLHLTLTSAKVGRTDVVCREVKHGRGRQKTLPHSLQACDGRGREQRRALPDGVVGVLHFDRRQRHLRSRALEERVVARGDLLQRQVESFAVRHCSMKREADEAQPSVRVRDVAEADSEERGIAQREGSAVLHAQQRYRVAFAPDMMLIDRHVQLALTRCELQHTMPIRVHSVGLEEARPQGIMSVHDDPDGLLQHVHLDASQLEEQRHVVSRPEWVNRLQGEHLLLLE